MGQFTRSQVLRQIATAGRLQLAGADLSGVDLAGLTLVGADLSYVDLTGADLSDAQLMGASLWSAQANGARFCGANLAGANLGLADLAGADMRRALLERADLTGTRLDRADMTGACLRGAWLDAMQRAMAVGAPPLQHRGGRAPLVCILEEGRGSQAVAMRCGDRLELHLHDTPDATHGEVRLAGAAILSGPEASGTAHDGDTDSRQVLVFTAMAPGRGQLILEARAGTGRHQSFEVLVTP